MIHFPAGPKSPIIMGQATGRQGRTPRSVAGRRGNVRVPASPPLLPTPPLPLAPVVGPSQALAHQTRRHVIAVHQDAGTHPAAVLVPMGVAEPHRPADLHGGRQDGLQPAGGALGQLDLGGAFPRSSGGRPGMVISGVSPSWARVSRNGQAYHSAAAGVAIKVARMARANVRMLGLRPLGCPRSQRSGSLRL